MDNIVFINADTGISCVLPQNLFAYLPRIGESVTINDKTYSVYNVVTHITTDRECKVSYIVYVTLSVYDQENNENVSASMYTS